jgi:hypothetical protein
VVASHLPSSLHPGEGMPLILNLATENRFLLCSSCVVCDYYLATALSGARMWIEYTILYPLIVSRQFLGICRQGGDMSRAALGRELFEYITTAMSTIVTYDHRLKRIGHPVRSAIHKLVIQWIDAINRANRHSVESEPLAALRGEARVSRVSRVSRGVSRVSGVRRRDVLVSISCQSSVNFVIVPEVAVLAYVPCFMCLALIFCDPPFVSHKSKPRKLSPKKCRGPHQDHKSGD